MSTMHVPLVELLCHMVMGHILAFECLLPGARGCLRLRPAMPGIEIGYLLWARSYQTIPMLRALEYGH
jgi:hypothetical protein